MLASFLTQQIMQPLSREIEFLGKRDVIARAVMTAASTALIIIGALAVCRGLCGPALGGSVGGLGILNFTALHFSSKKETQEYMRPLLASVSCVALGVLGATGVLSGFHVGLGVLGTGLASTVWKREYDSKRSAAAIKFQQRKQAEAAQRAQCQG